MLKYPEHSLDIYATDYQHLTDIYSIAVPCSLYSHGKEQHAVHHKHSYVIAIGTLLHVHMHLLIKTLGYRVLHAMSPLYYISKLMTKQYYFTLYRDTMLLTHSVLKVDKCTSS